MEYMGSQPAGHKEAEAASTAWVETIRQDVAPERVGLAKAALFALFRLSDRERAKVAGVFCRGCGTHRETCWCQSDE